MKTAQNRWTESAGWEKPIPGEMIDPELILVFASSSSLEYTSIFNEIHSAYPDARITGCTTAGEIQDTEVSDNSISITLVRFDQSHFKTSSVQVASIEESYQAGKNLTASLETDELRHVFVLSDGLNINGSELVRGLGSNLPDNVSITGGLSADGARFQETHVMINGEWLENSVVMLALYGKALTIGYGSLGGWDPFGPERLITHSSSNTLYELDGKSALDLYKTYLGEHADELPSAGLLFPLAIRSKENNKKLVRTILAIDDELESMTFAGDVPEGYYAQFMKANFDRLVDGAIGAARTSYESICSDKPELAILISCVGRKLVLKQRVEEEVEGVRDVFGDKTTLTGFYSYGEISPFTQGGSCELHNQTMTITTISEKSGDL